MALELLEQAPECDTIVAPVGGGGLLAGVATAAKALRPDIRIVAVEPENAAGFLAACLRGSPGRAATLPTVADGLAVERVGTSTFALAAPLIDDVVTVSEAELTDAIGVLARDAGIVAEGAGAASVAAAIAGKLGPARAVVLPVTGRNVDARLHGSLVARPTRGGHSARSAITGSTFVARRAGNQHATRAAVTRIAATPTTIHGSFPGMIEMLLPRK
jgi:threonine dehydratase